MKKIIGLTFFLLLMHLQYVFANFTAPTIDKVKVIFQNNSGKKGIQKFSLVIITTNGSKKTEVLSISGDMSIRKNMILEIGTKVYVSNASKLNTLTGGKAPQANSPLLIVMERDNNQVINLVEEVNAKETDVLANAAKAAIKLKLPTATNIEVVVSGNIATVNYTDADGNLLANFDCDKKTGKVKNIIDLRKKK